MRFDFHITEDIDTKGFGITFIDIDETLFNTFAKILVIKDGKVIKELSNSEYNNYRAKEGESFDFSQFSDAELFYRTSKPIEKMVKRAARIIKRAHAKGSRVIILTARGSFDKKDVFLNKFRQAGIPIDLVRVELSKNRDLSIAMEKKMTIMKYLNTGIYRRVRVFDDYIRTCRAFLHIKDDLPKETYTKIRDTYQIGFDVPDEEIIKFEAWHVQSDGSIQEIKQ